MHVLWVFTCLAEIILVFNVCGLVVLAAMFELILEH